MPHRDKKESYHVIHGQGEVAARRLFTFIYGRYLRRPPCQHCAGPFWLQARIFVQPTRGSLSLSPFHYPNIELLPRASPPALPRSPQCPHTFAPHSPSPILPPQHCLPSPLSYLAPRRPTVSNCHYAAPRSSPLLNPPTFSSGYALATTRAPTSARASPWQ